MKNGKLAAQKYVTPKPGKAPMTIKPNVQMPSVKPMAKTPAQKGGLAEDLGHC